MLTCNLCTCYDHACIYSAFLPGCRSFLQSFLTRSGFFDSWNQKDSVTLLEFVCLFSKLCQGFETQRKTKHENLAFYLNQPTCSLGYSLSIFVSFFIHLAAYYQSVFRLSVSVCVCVCLSDSNQKVSHCVCLSVRQQSKVSHSVCLSVCLPSVSSFSWFDCFVPVPVSNFQRIHRWLEQHQMVPS